jgi:opacity protein-like surface antigen
MKLPILICFALAAPVLAGTEAKQVIIPSEPAQPWNWFAGGSVGYLNDFDEEMYHLHAGADTPWSVAGWNVALFGEVGYTEKEENFRGTETSVIPQANYNVDLDSMADALQALADSGAGDTGFDLNVMPLTFNVKFERQLTGNLGAYVGAGLGVADVDLSINAGEAGRYSDADWVFVFQAFAGLVYNVNPSFEIYGGARWISFDEAELSDGGESGTLDLGDDCLIELGARYNF